MVNSLPVVGKVMNWLEAAGFTVSYLYEDLVFVESNAFLIRFEQSNPFGILIHINIECEPAKAVDLERLLLKEAPKHGIKPLKGGRFTLSEKNDAEIDIRFED